MTNLLGWKGAVIALAATVVLAYAVFGGGGGSGYVPPETNRATVEPQGDFNRAKFLEALKSLAPGRIVDRVEKGLSDHEALVTAGPGWAALDAEARQTMAEAMWKAWADLHPETLRYKTRIVILDSRGGKIGGSRLLDPSKIWVRQP